MNILCVGEALVDIKLVKSGAVLFPGGSCFNVAHYANKHGGNVVFYGSVGKDFLGEEIIKKAEFKTKIKAVNENTTVVIIRKGDSSPEPIVYRGADRFLSLKDFGNVDIFHTSAFAVSLEPSASRILDAMEVAKERGAIISFDPNYRRVLWKKFGAKAINNMEKAMRLADIVKPSIDDAFEIFNTRDKKEIIKNFVSLGAKYVVLSTGRNGAVLYYEDKINIIPAVKTRVVDTTGAGDALLGTFLAYLSKGYDPKESLEFGVKEASIVVSKRGNLV